MRFLVVVLSLGLQVFSQPLPPVAPDLVIPSFTTVRTATNISELSSYINGASDNTIIYIADGTYKLSSMVQVTANNVWVVGASKDPAKVVLRGNGFFGNEGGTSEILRVSAASNVTIAYCTFSDVRTFGVNVKAETYVSNLNIYNCYFINIGERLIKGTGWDPPRYVEGGSVRYCYFRNDTLPLASWNAGGNYIAAIDMMNLNNWVFADNVFCNIRGLTGDGRGSLFLWNNSQNCVVERNTFYNSNRLLALGNPSTATSQAENTPHMTGCVVRNNFIVRGPETSLAIELCRVNDVKIYNNTFAAYPLSYRSYNYNLVTVGYPPNSGIAIRNNLHIGNLPATDAEVTTENNYRSASGEITDAWFADLPLCDLHLTATASPVFNGTGALSEVAEDIDGCPRSASPQDFGADEYGCDGTEVEAAVIVNSQAGELHVEPNPFHGKTKIAGNWQIATGSAHAAVSIYDIHGTLIQRVRAGKGPMQLGITWDASALPAGIYVIQARAGSRVYVARAVVLR